MTYPTRQTGKCWNTRYDTKCYIFFRDSLLINCIEYNYKQHSFRRDRGQGFPDIIVALRKAARVTPAVDNLCIIWR